MRITVFTPTYNRAYIIENLYRSLQRQTFVNFEWLVVDDGSTDNTKQLFEQWIKEENLFSIRYYRKENGGKHRAINYALDRAYGELFFTVDSDDYLTSDALEKVDIWEKSIINKIEFCGIAGNLGSSIFQTINPKFRSKYVEKTLLGRYCYKESGEFVLSGERAIIFYTEIHKKYKYPEFTGEKFMTEAVTWNRMANDRYKVRFYNDIICIYKYLDDGLTQAGSTLFLKNPYGYGLWLKERAVFMKYSIMDKIKMYYTFYSDLENLYSKDAIAKCINTKLVNVKMISTIREIKRKWQDIKNEQEVIK